MNKQHFTDQIKQAEQLLEGGVIAVGYKNLKTGGEFFYNEDHVFPAASIVKVPIMLEYFRQRDKGALKDDTTVPLKDGDIVGGAGVLFELHRGVQLTLLDLLRLMIVISDNTASNIMLDRVGMDEINAFMKSLGLNDTVIGRKFMIDPNAKFSKNFTSVQDMVKLYEILYRGGILSEQSRKEALDILSRQQYREKIPLLLPKKMKVCHKTGEISGVRHDCALVMFEKAPYILCVLTEKMPDVVEADRVIAQLSLDFYRETVKAVERTAV